MCVKVKMCWCVVNFRDEKLMGATVRVWERHNIYIALFGRRFSNHGSQGPAGYHGFPDPASRSPGKAGTRHAAYEGLEDTYTLYRRNKALATFH
jgi:hypothetical protein